MRMEPMDGNALYNDLTPLMIASRNGRVNAVTFLVEHGADMDLQDKKGMPYAVTRLRSLKNC